MSTQANNEIFKQFASDVAMQVAANDEVVCLTTDDVPEDVKQKEKETEMAKDAVPTCFLSFTRLTAQMFFTA